ncbi:hypothetical protein ATANTOWER_003395 [Ataeniobius toweri]|uniref:Uncharacterized protein n=1 Tax=Ataeniobius toweri TaxID=208326 RepID=A0ABU7CAZ1_9TELE|nr:hypothetical protein [Ataeniobius toweri]
MLTKHNVLSVFFMPAFTNLKTKSHLCVDLSSLRPPANSFLSINATRSFSNWSMHFRVSSHLLQLKGTPDKVCSEETCSGSLCRLPLQEYFMLDLIFLLCPTGR